MKLVEKDGQKVLVFEEQDAALKEHFLAILAEESSLQEAYEVLDREHDIVCARRNVAGKRWEAWRLENHERMWTPVEAAVKQVLGEVPHMRFNKKTLELEVEDPKPEVSRLTDFLKMLQGVRVKLEAETGAGDGEDEEDGSDKPLQ